MKNIHVLPTDKLSKKGDLVVWNGYKIWDGVGNIPHHNRNLYITSEEEIKEGDYYITILDNEIFKADSFCIRIMNDANKYSDTTYKNTHFKIILTTDQDLIKDGIQSIPDEFLEWFVKNPSCEFIEIKHFGKCCCNPFISQCVDCKKYNPQYKIIIPKEESKQCELCKRYPRLEGTNKCESCYSVIRHFLEQDPELKDSLLPDLRKKQETLEEITEQIQKDCHKFVESIISKVTYQDATNTFLFMKLAELTLKLKKYE